MELIREARNCLRTIRAHPPAPEPMPDSPAAIAFDPFAARRLNTFVPITVVNVMPAEDTWKEIERFLDGWEELCLLSQSRTLTTWQVRSLSQRCICF